MEYIIKLSKAGKMPCESYSLPAQACKVGGKLATIKGSVCSGCYALKGNYRFPAVMGVRQSNLDALPTGNDWTGWIELMTAKIKASNQSGFFRWHDSGDIQNLAHYKAIIKVAELLPMIKFWLPTKESKVVRTIKTIPDNLVVRLSSPMIDQRPMKYATTSTVHTKGATIHGHECNAPKQEGKCMLCRACWDKSIVNVSYIKH
jgi:hypothetical protein